MMPMLAVALTLCLPALVLTAAVSDAMTFRIPNWISLALLAIFPLAALAAGLPLMTVAQHVGVGAALLAVGVAMFALRWIGGGDAKLLAAAGLWLGWAALPQFLLGAATAGGFLAVVVLSLRSTAFRPLTLLGPRWIVRLGDKAEGIPYGVAIAAGACMALSASPFGPILGL